MKVYIVYSSFPSCYDKDCVSPENHDHPSTEFYGVFYNKQQAEKLADRKLARVREMNIKEK